MFSPPLFLPSSPLSPLSHLSSLSSLLSLLPALSSWPATHQTVIECLKMATTGELPPSARAGQAFIHDPKVEWCRLKVSNPKLKALLVSALETKM
jgi:hypothetical protein